ncbi:MAG: thiamine phosphate synthase [Candidatus Cloacimonetes bacterium]|jgi:thiamine-phosphate pyrophosphorylase|nr:thiamine phosphate synthase [Candidatus Cloacimonadota bacterium]MBT6994803.1 thiamine phosphate synthase [Candidatus Cloacimonadota bacterium]MBT7470104.1 thiamine phosphate synthase [Candidatus Cloacimonadota bacterium]
MENFGIYVIITKPVLSYREIAEICVRNEVTMLQLREKHLTDRQLLQAAREIISITKGTKTNFVINDRPDIAMLCNADYLHLGQTDLTISEARKIVGKKIKIGLSTHSIQQAQDAISQKPDYIGFGPVFPTTTKIIPDPTVGTKNLQTVLKFAEIPVIAIGGIFPGNIDEVLQVGAKNLCLVRHFMETSDFENRLKKIKEKMR